MALKKTLKGMIEHIPYGIGRWMALVPFRVRLGKTYVTAKRGIAEGRDETAYAVAHFRKVFEYAREKFPCYRELYEKAGVMDLVIRSMADVKKVPIIDKQWTRAHFGEFTGAYKLNTGGSSGTPTPFWMDGDCWAREWAHMHTIWEMMGYRYTDIKLAIRGKNLGMRPFVYNPVHNEFMINTYLKVGDYANELKKLFVRRKIQWFHGYPSSIYQFILECESAYGTDGTKTLFRDVKGLMLSSEFPHPYVVEKFNQYNLAFVSWYGHSEMCILAYDASCAKGGGAFANCYHPFVTYGMTEVENGHLIGTSYHNFSMPLIRYDTGDLVKDLSQLSLPNAQPTTHNPQPVTRNLQPIFAIKEGRSGDFIEDKHGKKIPLTALIFGRHHKAFDIADYIQISQSTPGCAKLLVTVRHPDHNLTRNSLPTLFDLTNVDIDWEYDLLTTPIRTPAGKLNLRVS